MPCPTAATATGWAIDLIEGTDDDSDNQILAVQNGYTSDPTDTNNFITFFRGDDTAVGSIEGDSSGGITMNSGSADYAEYLPRLRPAESIEPAEVVGVVDGAVTKRTTGAEQALVVSDQPIVKGNSPGQDPADRERYEVCAFVGQVPVKVRGPVDEGDLVVPSGADDGTGRAIVPSEWRPGDGPIVGRAWESDSIDGVSEVTVAVGIDDPSTLGERLAAHRERIDEQAAHITELEAENEALRERLAEIEAHVGLASEGPAAADDD